MNLIDAKLERRKTRDGRAILALGVEKARNRVLTPGFTDDDLLSLGLNPSLRL